MTSTKPKAKSGLGRLLDSVKDIQPVSSYDLPKPHAIKKSSSEVNEEPIKQVHLTTHRKHIEKQYGDLIEAGEKIIKVDPNRICLSPTKKDRQENELGDLKELGDTMKTTGQIQPCVVEVCEISDEFDYVLTIGERRWRAAKLVGTTLDVVVRESSDTESFEQQLIENLERHKPSAYALGMYADEALKEKRTTKKRLMELLKVKDVDLSRILSFASIPKEIIEAIGNMQHVTSRTGSEIRSLANKGEDYIAALIKLAPRIEKGKLGGGLLQKEVDKILNGSAIVNQSGEIRSVTGQHLFSWRKDSNNNDSISFPKDIRARIDKKRIQEVLKEEIEQMLLKSSGL